MNVSIIYRKHWLQIKRFFLWRKNFKQLFATFAFGRKNFKSSLPDFFLERDDCESSLTDFFLGRDDCESSLPNFYLGRDDYKSSLPDFFLERDDCESSLTDFFLGCDDCKSSLTDFYLGRDDCKYTCHVFLFGAKTSNANSPLLRLDAKLQTHIPPHISPPLNHASKPLYNRHDVRLPERHPTDGETFGTARAQANARKGAKTKKRKPAPILGMHAVHFFVKRD